MAAQREAQRETSQYIDERISVLDKPLVEAPVGDGNTTGFFRNNFCDASPLDPGSHTVAAVVNKDFLEYSANVGNDLRSLFPSLYSSSSSASQSSDKPCVWCLCASRWAQALRASATHPLGEKIVPSVILEATHRKALRDGGIEKDELVKYRWKGESLNSGSAGGGGAMGGGKKEIIGR
ncbi:uncharacterized protein JCM6883_001251 [Sporobolomyces salmoneus]|uniref:uncharacterized protein n=1 Tax=Sporobolomyces salmoneus TaxID=183962 RepID=UPI003170EBF5